MLLPCGFLEDVWNLMSLQLRERFADAICTTAASLFPFCSFQAYPGFNRLKKKRKNTRSIRHFVQLPLCILSSILCLSRLLIYKWRPHSRILKYKNEVPIRCDWFVKMKRMHIHIDFTDATVPILSVQKGTWSKNNPDEKVLCASVAAQCCLWVPCSVHVQTAWRAGEASTCVSAKDQKDMGGSVIIQNVGTAQKTEVPLILRAKSGKVEYISLIWANMVIFFLSLLSLNVLSGLAKPQR